MDFTNERGLLAGRLLADLGADVIRVETPDRGVDALYATRNANKRSAVLDDDELRQLLSFADVWLDTESNRLDVHDVRRAFPELVIVSISPFGRAGPWRNRPANEFTVQAWSGSIASRGPGGKPPLCAGGRLGEWLSGAFAGA